METLFYGMLDFSTAFCRSEGMKNFVITLGVLSFLAACSHQENTPRQISFVSKKASEATLTFEHSVQMESATKPTVAEAKEQVAEQVQHMFGPMERSDTMAAPKEDHEIELNSSDIEKIEDGLWKISYRYSGTLVLQNGPRTGSPPSEPRQYLQSRLCGRTQYLHRRALPGRRRLLVFLVACRLGTSSPNAVCVKAKITSK